MCLINDLNLLTNARLTQKGTILFSQTDTTLIGEQFQSEIGQAGSTKMSPFWGEKK